MRSSAPSCRHYQQSCSSSSNTATSCSRSKRRRTTSRVNHPYLLLVLSAAAIIFTGTPPTARAQQRQNIPDYYPSSIHLRAAILTNTVPLAYVVDDESLAHFPGRNQSHVATNTNNSSSIPFAQFQGFQPDLLRELQVIARDMHDITLTIDLQEAPAFSYNAMFESIATDCNTSVNRLPLEECNRYDLVIGDYYAFPPRPLRAHLTPPLITTSAAALKYIHRQKRDVTTFAEAQALQEPVCILDESFYDIETLERYPDLMFLRCYTHEECLSWLKSELCVLFVEDELQLKYIMVHDDQVELTRESFGEQYVLWPMNKRIMNPLDRELFVTWIYQAKVTGVLERLYNQYFSVHFCPVGKAGANCELPCNPSHGISNRFGHCVCDSTRWTGPDCGIELTEQFNLLPLPLVYAAYTMVAITFGTVLLCAIWLTCKRKRAQVRIAQPGFLWLILLGCLISTSTILAMAQEDIGDGPVPACMVSVWLYSVGFCITFGTLFAKIRRIYILLQSAAEMRRVRVTMKETLMVVGLILLIDVAILTVWTVVDPLAWERTVVTEDKYGYPLESEGHCQSEHWMTFVSIIGAYHFLLICKACHICYLARDLPERFADGKYVAIALFSNMQIFIVAVPVLVILASDPQASFFVRSVAIFMNDFVVIILIFGNLMYKVYVWDQQNRFASTRVNSQSTIQEDIRKYAMQVKSKRESIASSNFSRTSNFSKTTKTSFNKYEDYSVGGDSNIDMDQLGDSMHSYSARSRRRRSVPIHVITEDDGLVCRPCNNGESFTKSSQEEEKEEVQEEKGLSDCENQSFADGLDAVRETKPSTEETLQSSVNSVDGDGVDHHV